MRNEELLKAAITAAGALATTGKLSPEQSDKFLDYIVDETSLANNARVIKMQAETREINKIGVGKRVMLPATEATDPGTRRGVTTSKIELTTREFMIPFEISDRFAELAVGAKGDVKDLIVKMMAKQGANDLETLYLRGDVLGEATLEGDVVDGGSDTLFVKDPLLATFDGWLRKADAGNLFNANGANIGASVFSAMIRKMPTKFRRNRKDLRWFVPSDLAQLWRERVSARATTEGDKALGGDSGLAPFGIPLVEVPLLPFEPPTVQHVTLPGTTKVSLRYAPISNVVVTPTTLGSTPTAKFVENTDYEVDLVAGTINRKAGGAIGDGVTVKVTFLAQPQILLTHFENFIVGLGRDIRVEKDRNIYTRMDQYAVTLTASVACEEPTAIVKGYNVGLGV